ncbi:release factor glutamine methyltransferase [Methylomarinovum tepidoasis]|uniref:Release factor glutamine methyltransferase n=1 Tax=Methylomarinovum tepidoasis TaxID=2840183 RepID=A0AAU9BYY3_9GAMM|nr:peptide chain release factor N(5)-glutamine methyltransferase [Methylomarinovum sp. IN45]BCX88783.1 release factor glutamine methyltransferase [Methylomarinovum sp. IN45]
MPTIAELLRQGRQRLQGASPTPELDAEVLLAHVLGKPRSHLRAWPEQEPEPAQIRRYLELLERRRHREPVAYLTGQREFWSHTFEVGPGVLIPRPETESLVERALHRIHPEAEWRLADAGTGSGALAVTLQRERPRCFVLATDRSFTALQLARRNARRLGARIALIQADWLAPVATASLDLIVSNPPYIPAGDPHLRGEIRFEPRQALVAGIDGLAAYRTLIPQARRVLRASGWLLLEHGHDQHEPVAELLKQAGFRNISGHPDLQGHIRVTEAQRSP